MLRLGAGDRVVVFDGLGSEATAQIVAPEGKTIKLRILAKAKTQPLPCAITLGQAVPRAKTWTSSSRKPWNSARPASPRSSPTARSCSSTPPTRKRNAQSGTRPPSRPASSAPEPHPEVLTPRTPKAFFESGDKYDLMLIASLQPDARRIKEVLAEVSKPANVLVLVGPEGDFTPAEISLAKSFGCQPITLGPIILRTETAALYCLSVLAHELF